MSGVTTSERGHHLRFFHMQRHLQGDPQFVLHMREVKSHVSPGCTDAKFSILTLCQNVKFMHVL